MKLFSYLRRYIVAVLLAFFIFVSTLFAQTLPQKTVQMDIQCFPAAQMEQLLKDSPYTQIMEVAGSRLMYEIYVDKADNEMLVFVRASDAMCIIAKGTVSKINGKLLKGV